VTSGTRPRTCAASIVATGALLLGASLPPARAAEPPPPPLHDLLDRAGRYVSDLEEQLAVVLGDEAYTQSLFLGRERSARDRRSIASDVAWVPTGDPMVWAFYRDVRAVDGQPVPERAERLQSLFPTGLTLAARERAQRILQEGARYNLGRQRNVNSPTVALGFLHPRNQARFEFRIAGRDDKAGLLAWKVRFNERRRPTLIRTSRGDDVPARGMLWVEPDRGAVVASRLEASPPPGLWPVWIDTEYRLDPRLGFWLPAEMQESYGNEVRSPGDERVETVARYSAWRRAQVEVQDIIPVPPVKP
jgi:hypothetical protein